MDIRKEFLQWNHHQHLHHQLLLLDLLYHWKQNRIKELIDFQTTPTLSTHELGCSRGRATSMKWKSSELEFQIHSPKFSVRLSEGCSHSVRQQKHRTKYRFVIKRPPRMIVLEIKNRVLYLNVRFKDGISLNTTFWGFDLFIVN